MTAEKENQDMPRDLYRFLERCLAPAATHGAGALAAASPGPRSAGPGSCRTLQFAGDPDFWPNDHGDAPRMPRQPHEPARRHRHPALTGDCGTPPPTERRHGRARILAVMLALVLAVILIHAGW